MMESLRVRRKKVVTKRTRFHDVARKNKRINWERQKVSVRGEEEMIRDVGLVLPEGNCSNLSK